MLIVFILKLMNFIYKKKTVTKSFYFFTYSLATSSSGSNFNNTFTTSGGNTVLSCLLSKRAATRVATSKSETPSFKIK